MIRKADKQGYTLITIHDSFWCHPNYMQKTRENYKDIMIYLAKQPIMAEWLIQMGFIDATEIPQEEVDNFVFQIESMEYMLS